VESLLENHDLDRDRQISFQEYQRASGVAPEEESKPPNMNQEKTRERMEALRESRRQPKGLFSSLLKGKGSDKTEKKLVPPNPNNLKGSLRNEPLSYHPPSSQAREDEDLTGRIPNKFRKKE